MKLNKTYVLAVCAILINLSTSDGLGQRLAGLDHGSASVQRNQGASQRFQTENEDEPTAQPTVVGAKLDGKGNLVVDLIFGGTSSDHNFTLKVLTGDCEERSPVVCPVEVIDNTPDAGQTAHTVKKTFSLSEYKLDTEYYKGATLKILGAPDESGKRSKATVTLP